VDGPLVGVEKLAAELEAVARSRSAPAMKIVSNKTAPPFDNGAGSMIA
jgi:hypothetical protein